MVRTVLAVHCSMDVSSAWAVSAKACGVISLLFSCACKLMIVGVERATFLARLSVNIFLVAGSLSLCE